MGPIEFLDTQRLILCKGTKDSGVYAKGDISPVGIDIYRFGGKLRFVFWDDKKIPRYRSQLEVKQVD